MANYLIPNYIEQQLVRAYKAMAVKVRYRPAVSDEVAGNTSVPLDKVNLDPEARKYAQAWWDEEEECSYFIGCPDGALRPAMMYAIEAARLMCGAPEEKERIAKLLQMAKDAVQREREESVMSGGNGI